MTGVEAAQSAGKLTNNNKTQSILRARGKKAHVYCRYNGRLNSWNRMIKISLLSFLHERDRREIYSYSEPSLIISRQDRAVDFLQPYMILFESYQSAN